MLFIVTGIYLIINQNINQIINQIKFYFYSHSVVDILPPESDSSIQLLAEKPDVSYHDIGGMDIQKQEVREAVELPLTQFELYKQIGIDIYIMSLFNIIFLSNISI